jgi:hypothetical protein
MQLKQAEIASSYLTIQTSMKNYLEETRKTLHIEKGKNPSTGYDYKHRH